MVKWRRRSRERAKRVPLTMGQGEMEEEEGKSEAPLTLPHDCFATLAVPRSTVTGGKASHGAAGVAFGCDAAASLRNGPGVARRPTSNVAAASLRFLDANHLAYEAQDEARGRH